MSRNDINATIDIGDAQTYGCCGTTKTKLDVNGIYQRGSDDISVERLSWEAILEALPVEEQVRWYEVFQEARRRAEAGDFSQSPIETTVTRGTRAQKRLVELDDQ